MVNNTPIAKRIPRQTILKEYVQLQQDEYIPSILNAIPLIAMILNQYRQIIYGNTLLLQMLGLDDKEDFIGARPGEVFHCIHAHQSEDGCGFGEDCRFCGAMLTVLQSLDENKEISSDARITIDKNGTMFSYDFRVNARPFKIKDLDYTLVSIEDVNNEKRRIALERIFFHDIMNQAVGLDSFISLLKNADDKKDVFKLLDNARTLSRGLIEDIQSQRTLLAAETGKLQVVSEEINSKTLFEELISEFKLSPLLDEITLIINPVSTNFIIKTEPALFKRVLTNMIKNALEASRPKEKVTITATMEDDLAVFSVHNQAVMSEAVQSQVFQRSFSTKGSNRGLGTYSIRLLTEQYLKGKVFFTSAEGKGTVFRVVLPTILK